MVKGFIWKDLYPSLFQISTTYNMPFSHFIHSDTSSSSSFLSCDLHFRRDVRDEELNVLIELQGSLERVSLVERAANIKWVWDSSCYFQLNLSMRFFLGQSFSLLSSLSCRLESADPIQSSSVLVDCSARKITNLQCKKGGSLALFVRVGVRDVGKRWRLRTTFLFIALLRVTFGSKNWRSWVWFG